MAMNWLNSRRQTYSAEIIPTVSGYGTFPAAPRSWLLVSRYAYFVCFSRSSKILILHIKIMRIDWYSRKQLRKKDASRTQVFSRASIPVLISIHGELANSVSCILDMVPI